MYQRQLADIAVHEKVGTASINQIKDQIADYNYTFYSDHRPGSFHIKKTGVALRSTKIPFCGRDMKCFSPLRGTNVILRQN